MDKYYHSIQDWNRFADAVTDLITDYIKYSSWIDGNDGIYVDENDKGESHTLLDAFESKYAVSWREYVHTIVSLYILLI